MKKRILAFILAFVMVLGMLPTVALAEEGAQTAVYEALVATDVAVDGSLNEADWLTNGKLSGGQAFDILWDGANLYFAATAGESDTQLVVKVGEETILTADKTGDAFEAKVAYTTENVSTIENVTLAIGESTWTGNVSLVTMARMQKVVKSDLMSAVTAGVDYGTAKATADGQGITFALDTLEAPNSKLAVLTEFANPFATLEERNDTVGFEFNFDPKAIPASENGSIGVSNGVYAGMDLLLTDGNINGARLAIGNKSTGLYMRLMVTSSVKQEIALDRTVEDGAFDVKLLWNIDGSIEVYVDGVSKGVFAGVTNTAKDMSTSNLSKASMVHIRAERYDYTEAAGLYDDYLEFTISNMRLSKEVDVVYASQIATNTGKHDALVASDIVLDGVMNEAAWLAYDELGLGQKFDVLFDGNNLYFGVEAFTGDSKMTVEIDGQLWIDAVLPEGASAFEASVEYLTKGIDTLENVTITVGNSAWTGDINLVKYARKEVLSSFSLDGDAKPTAEGTGLSFHLPANASDTAKDYRAYALKTGSTAMTQRGQGVRYEFDFDPTGMTAHTGEAQSSSSWTANAGFNALLIGPSKERIVFGMDNIQDKGLVFIIQTGTWGKRATCELGRTAEEGVFHLALDWDADGNVALYVDGEYLTTFEGMQFVHSSETTTSAMLMEARRYRAYNAVDVAFKTDNMVFSLPAKVTYQTPDDGAFNAYFTDAEPVAGFSGWSSANWEGFTNVDGKAAALIYNQKVYLAVNAEGAVSATLNGETKTAEANGMTVLTFDNTTVRNYGEVLPLVVTVGEVEAWEAAGAVTVAQVSAGGAVTVLDATKGVIKSHNTTTNGDDNSITLISDASFPMYDNSNCAYWFYNKADLANAYDSSMSNLLEQTIYVEEMPIGDYTGTYNSTNQYQGWGYTSMLEFPSVVTAGQYDFFTSVLYPDAEGNLYLTIMKDDRSLNDPIALGKKIKEEFKLGMLCNPDGSQTIFVDGAEIATVSNARVVSGKIYSSAVMLKYMDPVTQTEGSENAGIIIKDVTVAKVGTKELIDLEEEITVKAIFGDLDLTEVSANLPLVTTFRSAYLGEHALRWTSSNEDAVETNGTIHPSMSREMKSTLSVYLDDSETALWSVDIVIPPSSSSLDALLSETAIVVDGKLSEPTWLNWKKFATLEGNIAAAWTKGNLYMAVSSSEADKLVMSINGVEVTVDLTAATVSGAEGAQIVKNAVNGVIELCIPMSAVNVNLTDYNQNVLFDAKLVNTAAGTEGKLDAFLLVFTGTIAEVQKLSSYTKDNGPWTLLTDSILYNGEQPGKVNYVYKTDDSGKTLDHKELIVLSTDFRFDALPISSGAMVNASAQADGFYYYFSDEDINTRAGDTICASIFTEDGTNLKIRIGQGQDQEGYVYDLGKTLGEDFRVTHYWYPDNTMDLYVDGLLLATVVNAGYRTSYLGKDVVTYRYYSPKVTAEKVKFSIFNQTRIVEKYETVLDELTQNAVFGRIDLDHVQKNLPMVTTFASANFEALNLKWTSSDESVVAVDGTVTRHATEAKSAELTVYFVDEDGTEIKLWSVTVTVDPMSVTKQPAPDIIHTGFAKPGTITVDGVVETAENWLFNGWILNDDQQPVASFGAQWDEENLYIVLDTELPRVTLCVGDIAYTVDMVNGMAPATEAAFNGTVAELKIPFAEFSEFDAVTEYGKTIDIVVGASDSGFYSGTLNLSNVSWWGTDNIYAGLPMLANNVKSVRYGTGDTPDGNQGAKQLENGWRLFDLYDENGTNPAGIRTYVLFMKMPVYENFADRTEATHIEFDFNAKSMPVGEWDEGLRVDSLARAFANYGVTFSLSDKADSGKNSNVAVFGITNTADGLVMVVNRGSEDYDAYPLNKQVGEEFRLGLTWLTNSNLVLTIDGEEFITIEGMSKWVNSVGDTSFVINMLRNKQKPTSSADDMDVYFTNIAFGKAHSQDDIIRNLTFEDIAGANEDESSIISDLELLEYMTNGQLSKKYPISWTSSDAETIDVTGKVTRPAHGVKFVTLTATLDNNGVIETKSFDLIVLGESVDNGNTLVIAEDANPFTGKGYEYGGLLYNLDKTNNSVIYSFDEAAESTKFNLVTLTDLDQFSRLNRRSLRLFVSDDNATYTEIEDYKLHHDGYNWYLYDFEADARYVKVHFTHRDYDATDFFNTPGEMIHVAYDASLAIPADAYEVSVPATTLLDETVKLELPADVTPDYLHIALDGKLLFHYVDDNGTVYVRIPDPTDGTLKLWNAGEIELADKENVYEVTYGTTETQTVGGRWLLSVKAGTTFPDGSSVTEDTLFRMNGKSITMSTDGGYTWTSRGSINFSTDGLSSGGWGIDSKTGRMLHEFYGTAAFVGGDITKTKCITYVFYSDDGGKTWTKAEGLGQVEGDLQSNYVLSYTDLTELAGNDGEGPNVDFVFPMGAQYNNSGAFCGRVGYTTDGGLTWSYSASKITYGNETAFEGGVSEATILEREDGTLVYYARCQSSGVDNFTISYSLDHGVTWLTPGATSSIYTTNTQALMMTYDFDGFDGNRLTGTPMFMWGGNNVLGGNSYQRMPLNFAISTNGMDTFREIQNIFFGTFQDVYTTEADHYITNPSIQQIDGDNMYLAYSRLYHKDSVYTVVNNFTDWFLRTKGAYDSFEQTSALGEGWRHTRGTIETTSAKASEGVYSLLIKENTQATRSVPYIQNGTVELDVYADASSNFVIELQPAYSNSVQKCAAISVKVIGTTMVLTDGTEIALNEGWNVVSFNLHLMKDAATVAVNAEAPVSVPVDTEAGDYVTYLTVLATSNAYVDELLIIESADVVLEATEADKAAADEVIDMIKAIEDGDAKAIKAAKDAYNALTQVQQDLVNRRVPTGSSTDANDEGALINWYEYLMGLTAEDTEVEFAGSTMELGNDLSLNFIVKQADAADAAYAIVTFKGVRTTIEKEEWIANGEMFRISFNKIAAKEMTDEASIQLFDTEGNAISEIYTDSIRAYAGRMLVREDSTEELKIALVDALNYGAAAQVFFNYKADDLANNELSDEQKALATQEVKIADIRETAAGYLGSALELESNIKLNFYFNSSFVGKTATVTYVDHYGNEKVETITAVANGSMAVVSLNTLVVADAYVPVTVEINGITVVDSVASYCARMQNTVSLALPLLKFATSAYNYFH